MEAYEYSFSQYNQLHVGIASKEMVVSVWNGELSFSFPPVCAKKYSRNKIGMEERTIVSIPI